MGYYSKNCKVINSRGIHARPSSLIADKAKELKVPQNTIFLKCNSSEKEADVMSVMSILMLAATLDEVITVYTNDKKHYKEKVDEFAKLIGEMKYD